MDVNLKRLHIAIMRVKEAPTMSPNVLLASEAAREKGCAPQTILNALSRGDLNGTRMGRHRLVFRDEAYAAFGVQETGGRLHERYQEQHED